MKQARQVIEARAKEMAAARADAAEQKPRGPAPKAPSEVPAPKAQYNFTDPESRIMKAGNGRHFEPAYNAPAAVDAAMLIVGQRVSAAPIQAVEQKPDGTPSGGRVYAAVEQQTHHQTVAQLLPQPEPAPLREHATPKERMAPRMKTSAGRTLYKLRKQTVEPVLGSSKRSWASGASGCGAGRKHH